MSSSAQSSTTDVQAHDPSSKLPDEVHVEHCIFSWTIENFRCKAWDPDEFICSPQFSTQSSVFSTWCIRLRPAIFEGGQQGIELLLQRLQSSCGYDIAYVTFRLGFGAPSGYKIWLQENRRAVFGKPDAKLLRTSLFEHLEDFCEDKLIVYCEMYSTASKERKPSEVGPDVELVLGLKQLSKDTNKMKHPLSEIANVLFQVKGRKYKLHKSILFARSTVFSWMLDDGNSYIELPDLNNCIMQFIFYYMYSGDLSLTLANQQICIGLYEAAYNLCISGLSEHLTPTIITGRTLLNVERTDFVWSIEHFSFRNPDDVITSPEFSGSFPLATGWKIALYIVENQESRKYLGLMVKASEQTEDIRACFEISILDRNGRSLLGTGVKRRLSPGCGFISYFENEPLMRGKDTFFPNDTLTLRCQLSFVIQRRDIISTFTTSADRGDGSLYGLMRLSSDLLNILKSGYLSDIEIKCKNVTFKVHKDILLSRTKIPVFPTLHKKVLETENLEPSVLQVLLMYMYSGILKDHPPAFMMNLYRAASEFKMPMLVKQCSDKLAGCLQIPIVIDVYCFATHYNDETLKYKCLEYMSAHLEEFFESEEWISFESYNALLAKEIRVMLKWNYV